jgi:hypothetical protein
MVHTSNRRGYPYPTTPLTLDEIEHLIDCVRGSPNLIGFEAPLLYVVEQLLKQLRPLPGQPTTSRIVGVEPRPV